MTNTFFNPFLLLYILLVLLISHFTYFQNYQNPPKQFWDENYHVVSAQKYIDGVAYMEPHPPLGKLLIAFGEVLINPNENIDKSTLLKTDYLKTFPKNFSFEGYRFFPTFFAMLNSILFFLICYFIIKNYFYSFLLTSLYLFENAYIVHSRAAMLESIQMFFILLSILYFFYLTSKDKITSINYAYLGLIIGLGLSVKLNGLIMIILFFFLFIFEYRRKEDFLFIFIIKQFKYQLIALFSLIFIFMAVFYIHFSLGKEMPTHKNYKISKEYKELIKEGSTSNILNMPLMIKDNFLYMRNYSKGVPIFNPCKKGENGSLSMTWPFGNKSINYRWEKKDGEVKYLYLQGNPIIWFSSFIAFVLCFVLVIGKYSFGTKIKNSQTFFYIGVFLTMYLSYMFVMYNIQRVMYLYHYFIPLVFSMILLVLLIKYIFEEEILSNNKIFIFSIILFVLNIILVYKFFSPLTYYEALGTYEFELRNWFDFWRLSSVK